MRDGGSPSNSRPRARPEGDDTILTEASHLVAHLVFLGVAALSSLIDSWHRGTAPRDESISELPSASTIVSLAHETERLTVRVAVSIMRPGIRTAATITRMSPFSRWIDEGRARLGDWSDRMRDQSAA